MLLNQAQTFYYANWSIIITWFDFKINMKKFFEKFKWHRMNLIKWQIVNLIDIISLNFILSTIEYFKKLVIEMNILQRNIDFQFDDQFHFRKNIIRIVRDHSAFLIKFINSADDIVNFVNNLQNSIINYETIHRFFTHEIYVQFYKNDEKKENETENETYYIDRSYKKKNQKCVIVIAFFDHATRININHLNQVFHVKKNVLYVKKLTVDSSIIRFKKKWFNQKIWKQIFSITNQIKF